MQAIEKIKDYCHENGKSVLLDGRANINYIRFLGSSLPASAKDDETVDSLSIAADKESGIGVVAVYVCWEVKGGKNNYTEGRSFLIPVRIKDSKISVDLLDPWVPRNDRLLQAYDHHLELRNEKGWIFTTNLNKRNAVDHWYVPDSTLLCKCAIGEIEFEELEKHVVEAVAEESAREQLKRAKAEIEKNRKEYWESLRAATQKCNIIAEEKKELQKQLEACEEQIWAAVSLEIAASQKRFPGKKLISAIDDFRRVRDKFTEKGANLNIKA